MPASSEIPASAKPFAADSTALPPELAKAMSQLTDIGSLPEVTTKIVAVVENPRSTAQDMHEIVKSDPVLATKILRVVNSAFYGLPSQISNLDRAIVMLGLSAVKNIALAASLSRLFRPGSISPRFAARDLWAHSLAVGVCGKMLAEKAHIPSEESFVAGLVHDVGLLVEYQLFPDKLRDAVSRCEGGDENFREVERATIGADHQAFGAALAQRWKFPPALRHAISHHHNPETLKPDLKRIATGVQVADVLCCQAQVGFYLTAQNGEVTDAMLEIAEVTREQMAEITEALPERLEEARKVFSDED